KLSCVNRVITGSGENRNANEKILWREEKTISPAELCPGPTGSCIPISFRLPLDIPQTDTTNSENSVTWLLEADADVPGVDYKDIFELPVFRTKDTPKQEEAEQLAEPASNDVPPADPTIMVRPTEDGATEFYFPAGRNKGFAFSTSVFCLVLSGTIWLQVALHAPALFPVVTG